MKSNNVLILAVLFIVLSLTACSRSDEDAVQDATESRSKETALEHAQKHLDPKYICPMHPQIIRDKAGNCPICGMDLVQKEAEEVSGKGEILYWVAPMDPNYRRDEPGKSPMGMDLIPVYADAEDASGLGGPVVKISPVVEHNLGVRTAPVIRDKLWRRINTVGYVNFDENMISHIHLRTKGWIEKLLVKSEGERVRKGQLLFEVYSPDLVNAQEEYLQALGLGNRRLIKASRERLDALWLSKTQIDRITKSRRAEQYVQVYAGQDGFVAALNVREGMFVMPSKEVMALADLSSIWLQAEVFEKQADWVKVGLPAEVRLSYIPGKVWEGEVQFVYPSLDIKTRTLKARLRFDNPDEALKPNMFADVTIYGGAKKDVLVMPREALIQSDGEARVIVALGGGRFQARQLVTGIESGDYVEVIEGLKEGEMVVTSAQFLIDSEASLKASLQRLSAPRQELAMDMAEAAPGRTMGQGTLKQVLPDQHKLNMSHGPIEALGWPAMTMDFQVDASIELKNYKAGDEVQFELEPGPGGYVIKGLRLQQQEGGQ